MSVADPVAPAPVPAPNPRPKDRSRWLIPLLALALGVGAGGAAVWLFAPPARPEPSAQPEAPKEEPTSLTFARDRWSSAGIRTEPVTSAALVDYAWRTGRVVLDQDRVAHVSPPVEGIVVDVRVQLGQEVKPGMVLAVLDSREVGAAKLEYIRARLAASAERERAGWAATSAANTAALVEAVATNKSPAEIDTTFKKRAVGERRQTLMTAYSQRNQLRSQVGVLRASGGSVAEVTLRKTEAELAAAEASLSALCEEFRFQSAQQARQAELKLKEAETALAAARTHLLILGYTEEELKKLDPAREGAAASRYEIRAPFAGTVVKRHAVRSERVGPQMEMFRIADLSTVWVEADAFEGDLPLIRALGSRGVVFRSPAAGISQRPAQLLYSGDIVDPNSRAMTVTASAPNPARELKPGMFVEVGIPRGGVKQVLQVPSSAVQRYQGKTFVFVHAKDDEFRRADVELGREGGNRVEIKSGLAAGDAVVVEGGFVLKSELLRDQLAGE